jgi:hypothetical protein
MTQISNNILEGWWAAQDFRKMELITGFRQSDFSPADAYWNFVDACDKWWDSLSYTDKVSIYKKFK